MHNRHQGWHQWTIFIRWPGISQLPGEFRPNSQDEPAVFAFQARSHWPKPRTKNMDYMYLKLVVAFLWNANPFAKWQIPAAWYCLVCLYIYIYMLFLFACLSEKALRNTAMDESIWIYLWLIFFCWRKKSCHCASTRIKWDLSAAGKPISKPSAS